MTRKKTSDWEDLIVEAACSGIDVSQFCSLHGLSKSWFYRMARRLGYMEGGKRTEKWEAAASGACATHSPVPALVAVPRGIVESGRTGQSGEQPDIRQPQIIIRYGEFQIAVGDRFSSGSLQRVLEVVAHA